MIVQPDFLGHWKTRLLIEITRDPAAPLSVIHLWAHCQQRRRGDFPNMTPQQLASICHWGERKPDCYLALLKAGFIHRISPKGFEVHEWEEHNKQLIQKWKAGEKGGRPASRDNPSKSGDSEEPNGYRPVTDRQSEAKPDSTDRQPGRNPIDQIDQIDQTRDKEAEREQGAPVAPAAEAQPDQPAGKPAPEVERPSLDEVLAYAEFIGLAPWKATDWFDEMQGGGWLDHQHRPVSDWRAVARRVKAKWEADGRPSGPPGAAQRQPDGKAPNPGRPTTDAHAIRLQKELERVEARLKAISDQGTHTAFGVSYTTEQKTERGRLILRKKELLQLLGFQA